jgi:PAS domain S-box-containing protein
MSYRSAVVDKNDRLIVGTAHGLAYLQKQIKDENITMSPILTQIVENNKNTLNKNQKLTFENNSYLEFSFITLTYPNDNIQYKWRLLGRDSTWSKPSFNTKIGLAQIESGEYKLQICSQNTGYYWSNPAEIEFVVNKPWYKTYNAIAFYVVFAALLIIALFHYLSLIREKKWVDQKIQSFVALSSDLIVIMDRNGAILYTNSVWLSKLSYLEDDLKGNNYFQFIDKSDHEKVKTEIIYLNTNGGSISLENRMFNKDGSIGYYSWNISISTDKEYLFGIGRDINEMMQMQSELKELNENKDKLFSVISHDLRSPFTSLLGYSKMLIEEFNAFDPEEIKEIIGLSYKSSQKAFDLLEDLFNWAKIQMNKITILIEERNITEIVNEELDLMQSQFLNKNISITKNIDNVISNIDYSSYRIVVKNILSNAFKFCKHNGSIAIKLIEEQNKIIFMVSDNGVGISPEKLLLIQKNKNHHSEYGSDGEKGSALGYELIHKYAECNNGIVELESVLSKGTTVKFTIERI